eukprot:gene14760-biopygen6608
MKSNFSRPEFESEGGSAAGSSQPEDAEDSAAPLSPAAAAGATSRASMALATRRAFRAFAPPSHRRTQNVSPHLLTRRQKMRGHILSPAGEPQLGARNAKAMRRMGILSCDTQASGEPSSGGTQLTTCPQGDVDWKPSPLKASPGNQ